MSGQRFRFEQVELPPEAEALRHEVRAFIAQSREDGSFDRDVLPNSRFSPSFSRRMGEKGWIGMTWPREYGGGGRSALERHVVSEEMLAANAPVRAHWGADRQAGPIVIRYGTDHMRRTYLPRMIAGECYTCVGMSEADSGSDLASIRTSARRVEGGWRVDGAKLWSSNAHRVHLMVLFVRTSPRGEDRHAGVSQFLVDLASPGVTIRPIINLAGEHDFNEVQFDDAFVPDEMVIGAIGAGWKQVADELAYERSGAERWLSTFEVVKELADALGPDPSPRDAEALGRIVSHLWTLKQMSVSIAGMLQAGEAPNTEAAIVKDIGTNFEREIVEVARRLIPPEIRLGDPAYARFNAALEHALLSSPQYTIRGGTREILRGIIARGLGLR